jgi:hypothetical protein
MTAEPAFLPRPGQVGYTHIRYAPVLNAVVVCVGKVLLLQRSSGMRSSSTAPRRRARRPLHRARAQLTDLCSGYRGGSAEVDLDQPTNGDSRGRAYRSRSRTVRHKVGGISRLPDAAAGRRLVPSAGPAAAAFRWIICGIAPIVRTLTVQPGVKGSAQVPAPDRSGLARGDLATGLVRAASSPDDAADPVRAAHVLPAPPAPRAARPRGHRHVPTPSR